MASYNSQARRKSPYETGKLGKYDRFLLERDRLSTVGLNNLLHLPIRVAAFFDDKKYMASKKAANIVLNDIFRLSKKADLIGEGQKIIKCSKNGTSKRDLDRAKLRLMKIGSVDSEQIRIKDQNGLERTFQRLVLAEVLSDPETFSLIVDLASHIFITRFGNEKAIKQYVKSSGKGSKKLEKDYKELISSIRRRHDIPKPISGGKAIGLAKYAKQNYEETYFSDEFSAYRPLGFDEDDVAGTIFEDFPERVARSPRGSGLYDAVSDFYGEPTFNHKELSEDDEDDDEYREELGEKISEMGDAIKQLTHVLQYSINVKDNIAAPPVFEKGETGSQDFTKVSKEIMRSLKAHDKAISGIARYLQEVIGPALANQDTEDDEDDGDDEDDDRLSVEDFRNMMASSDNSPPGTPSAKPGVLVSREEFHLARQTLAEQEIKDGGNPDLRRPEAVTYIDPDSDSGTSDHNQKTDS